MDWHCGIDLLRLSKTEINRIEKDLTDQFAKEYQFKTETIKTISVNGRRCKAY